ncbi:DUF523 domain-containing protein [Enterococcus sp. 5H]|uniref:DUF523 domain-containing protein n=1 Tax=Enterococcus sp. 5H TaxID=1229490 RepID=UPI0023031853|nr:DUF523 domain-containing protein [Enterococcus sp. 5H]MDA9470397.1 hypothetical protein [Enterococcus sp. 5H]
MIGISSCLGGICCRYDGQAKEVDALRKLVDNGQAILVCPEVLGGMPIPRDPAEIQGGDGFDVWKNQSMVITDKGEDVTEQFKLGAIIAYQKLIEANISTIILKENSPSCGHDQVYDGNFSGSRKNGVGVATAYFLSKGLQVISENNWKTTLEQDFK